MKRTKISIMLIVFMSMMSGKAFGHDIEVKNSDGVTIYYKWTSNGTELAVSSYSGDTHSLINRYSGNVVIPENAQYDGKTYHVTSIGDYAFYQCNELTSITIPNSVTSIGDGAFFNCHLLTSITIPNSVMSIGGSAFIMCNRLTSITIPNSVTSIGDGAFCAWGLASIKVETGNKKYDSRDDCNAIIETASNTLISGCKNTVIPNNVTSIGDRAFNNCRHLAYVTIPNNVTSIGNKAFSGCVGLKSITIPNSVTKIGDYVFHSCSSLKNITIPYSVTSIGVAAFNNIDSIKVEAGNKNYDSRDDCNAIIETASNTLISGCSNTVIPNSVTSIGDFAFQNCGLTSISIPNSVTSIGVGAFNASYLTSITIPNSMTNIGDCAFFGCNNLISATIGNSVTSIGDGAFYYCNNLTTVTSLNPTPPSIASNSFINYWGILQVPTGCKIAYQNAEYWKHFINIVEIDPSGIQTITLDKGINAPVYDLNGRKLKEPNKGINIIGGKKVVVK